MELPPADLAVILQPEHLDEMAGHAGPIRCATFSADGRLLATTAGGEGGDGGLSFAEVRVWDAPRRRLHVAMQGHQDTALCACFTPDCQTLVTGSKDHTLIVWDTSRGMHDVVLGLKDRTLRGHTGHVCSLSISPDGERLVSAANDGEIRVWDTTRWRCERVIPTQRMGICRVAHSPDGQFVAAVWRSLGPAMLWHATSWEEHARLMLWPEDDSEDYDLAFHPEGAFLAVLSASQLRIWDLSSCQVAIAFDAAGARSLAYSPDGKILAAAGWELKTRFDVQLWDPLTGKSLGKLEGHRNALYTVCFSPDGGILVCGGRDLAVHVWKI